MTVIQGLAKVGPFFVGMAFGGRRQVFGDGVKALNAIIVFVSTMPGT